MRGERKSQRDATRYFGGRFTRQDLAVAALLIPALLLLLLPLLPYPGDHATLMKIRFRDGARAVAHSFTLPVEESVCAEIAMTMAARDPASGAYTSVACNAAQRRAARRDPGGARHPGAT